jgi:hypothetical protein
MFTAISFPQNLAAQAPEPCNNHESPWFDLPPMPFAPPCPSQYADDSIQTVFITNPYVSNFSYCDQGLVNNHPVWRVIDYMDSYLNSCATDPLREGCSYTGDQHVYGYVNKIRKRKNPLQTYQIVFNSSSQSNHDYDNDYKNFVAMANTEKLSLPPGSCPFGHNSEWHIIKYELDENTSTGFIELRVTFKRVCCTPNYPDPDPWPPGPTNP